MISLLDFLQVNSVSNIIAAPMNDDDNEDINSGLNRISFGDITKAKIQLTWKNITITSNPKKRW